MIINNVVVGLDMYGKKLECGDICSYGVKKSDGDVTSAKGLIIYDEESYSFAFEQLDDNFPIVLMSKVEQGTINKLYNARHLMSDMKNAEKWVEIYNSNLLVAHLD